MINFPFLKPLHGLRLFLFGSFFTLFLSGVHAQTGTTPIQVSGRVTSATGEPMFGVSVLPVLSSGSGTSTNANGEYSLVAYSNDTLLFTSVGYKMLRVAVAGRSEVNVTLSVMEDLLDDVVVVAYGQQKRISVTGALSTVTTRELRQSPVANLSNAVAGRLPGLMAYQPSGEPGNDYSALFIRGMPTFNNSSPLIVVDGVLGRDAYNIDPNEVESFTILKDASSTAVYGVRGANGVILVTTRRGKTGRPSISFSAEQGYQSAMVLPKYLSSYDYARLYNEALGNDYLPQKYSEQDLEYYRIGADPYLYPNTDWLGTFLKKNSPMTRANLSISGGGERVKYFVSASALTQDGMYNFTDLNPYSRNTKYNRYNFRSNIDINVTNDLVVGLDLAGRTENRNYPGRDAWLIFEVLNKIPPTYPIWNPDGSLAGDQMNPDNPLGLIAHSGYRNFYANHLQGTYRMKHGLDFITKGLSAKAAFAFDASFDYNLHRTRNWAVYELRDDLGYNQYGAETELGTGKTFFYGRAITLEGGFDYARSFGNHSVTSTLLFNQNRRVTVNAPYDLPYDYRGYVGRFTYNYLDKYFGEINLGYNGSEQFPKENRYGFFPSFSAGWVISKENFYNGDNKLVNFLKLRGSYGEVGNDQMGARRYLYISTFNATGGYSFGPNLAGYGGINEGALANPNVTWERARKANLGIEVGAWDGRITFTGDVFYEKRDNILTTSGNIPYILGKSSGLPPVNIGVVENKGTDMELTFKNPAGRAFQYTFSGNFTFARNKVLFIDEESREYPYQLTTGKRVGQPFGYVAIGFYQSQEEIDNAPPVEWIAKSNLRPGDIRYKDINGDGFINSKDMVAIGYNTGIPEIMYGFSSRFGYKGFDLSFLFQGAANSSLFMDNFPVWEFRGGNGKAIEWHLDRWTPETATTATYPRLFVGDNNNNQRLSTFWMRPRDYVRLKNAEIGYTFKTTRFGIQSVRVYANGFNLLTWDNVKLTDPENPAWAGNHTYPQQRVYNFGFNVNF